MKHLLLVNDLSCVGKVAISAVLPIFNTLGIETSPVPTTLLSAHTGFTNPHRIVFLNDLINLLSHIKQLPICFDAILTGYLGDKAQVSILLDHLPQTELLIVDPVMADHGKLYRHFDQSFVSEMKRLCQHANIIMPNLTEACLLTDTPYLHAYTQEDIHRLLTQLSDLGPETVLITSVSYTDDTIGVAYKSGNDFGYYALPAINAVFMGSGDMFAALVTSHLLAGHSVANSVAFASDFLHACFQDTIASGRDTKYGILFEKQLHQLTRQGDSTR